MTKSMKENYFIVPIYLEQVYKTKKNKNISLNLNQYRNMHYIVNNNLKHQFKDLIKDQLVGKVYTWPITINYRLYWRRMSDLDNLQAVVTKYFQDALVECGCIIDDNFIYIRKNTYEAMAQDKKNPRMEIEITQYECKNI